MEYALVQAPSERLIITQCQREGLALPDKIANAPELHMGLELYYDAFWDLTTCRPAGFSLGAIPWSAVHEYGQAFDFSYEQRDWMHYLIRVLDQAYMKHHAPKKGGKGKGKGWGPQQALGNSRNA